MKIAIITGASSGLGREFVRQLGGNSDLDEIWAIARREDRLLELQTLCSVPVRPIPLDLTKVESFDALTALLQSQQPEVAILVCAAGFGRIGLTRAIPSADNDAMIDLNCKAAVAVTTAVLPYLRSGSRVLEICSTAGFQPMPGLNVYAATKAFLQSYTKALHHELLTSGIHVTAVCPYWIRDTEFIPTAQKVDQSGFRHFPLASRARTVVRWALADSRMNLWVSTPGPVCMVHRLAAKFIPHFVMVPLLDLLRRL
ncbi:MAG: SDR family NAD(P)-dependent oxidoreductase [Oscillibacter sp.]|jgi:short-subunit dehydrogenase|nr:SDR family NAD(P)-dependent oxidoreductase [Oscillibacter sp.]